MKEGVSLGCLESITLHIHAILKPSINLSASMTPSARFPARLPAMSSINYTISTIMIEIITDSYSLHATWEILKDKKIIYEGSPCFIKIINLHLKSALIKNRANL